MDFKKNTAKIEKTEENEYSFEQQRNNALKQFEKLYSNLKNNANTNNLKKEKTKLPPPKKIKAKFKKNTPKNFIDIFFKDHDKTLIIILIVMLMDNEENLIVVMALIYLLV